MLLRRMHLEHQGTKLMSVNATDRTVRVVEIKQSVDTCLYQKNMFTISESDSFSTPDERTSVGLNSQNTDRWHGSLEHLLGPY